MKHSYPGMFLVVEGVDAAGKTTQMSKIKAMLEDKGVTVVATREPGGTPVGEKIRELVLSTYTCLQTEVLLFAASRAHHVETLIKPALEAGHVVLCDRYMMSTYAYQGHGRGFKEYLGTVEHIAHGNFYPDYTLFFDLPLSVSRERLLGRRGNDRFDLEAEAFVQKVYAGYKEAVALALVPNIHVVDATHPIEAVTAYLQSWIDTEFYPAYLKRRK